MASPPLNEKAQDPDSDTDAILAELEAELDLPSDTSSAAAESTLLSTSPRTASLLAARKAELQSQSQSPPHPAGITTGRIAHSLQGKGLQTPTDEASLIKTTADAQAALVVFYSHSFALSLRMKDLVSSLASAYSQHSPSSTRDHAPDAESTGTVFFAAEAEKSEWLARRLKIQVLPVVVGYVEGKEVGRIVGFEGLRGGEGASWRALAWVVGQWSSGWKGTFARQGGDGGLLGKGWEDWINAGEHERHRQAGGDSEDDEDEREQRRKQGYVGGGGGNGRLKIGGRKVRQGVGDDDEDDEWD